MYNDDDDDIGDGDDYGGNCLGLCIIYQAFREFVFAVVKFSDRAVFFAVHIMQLRARDITEGHYAVLHHESQCIYYKLSQLLEYPLRCR